MPVLQYYVVFVRTKIEDKPDVKTTRVTKIPPPLSIYEKTDSLLVMRAGRKCLRVYILGAYREDIERAQGYGAMCISVYGDVEGSLLRSVWVYSIYKRMRHISV